MPLQYAFTNFAEKGSRMLEVIVAETEEDWNAENELVMEYQVKTLPSLYRVIKRDEDLKWNLYENSFVPKQLEPFFKMKEEEKLDEIAIKPDELVK